jgi:hypothetical protein
MDNAQRLGERMERRRQRAGSPSYRSLARTLYDMLGVYAPTDESLRRLHVGRVSPEKADVVILAAIAEVYGCKVADFSASAADRAKAARDLLRRGACPGTPV